MTPLIDDRVIADTIISLMRAGKQMPQNDRMRGSENPNNTAKLILKETVDLWKKIFITQKISKDKWHRAEQTALTMTKADGLNINIITPALMQEALKRNEAEYLEAMRVKYEQEKKEEMQPINPANSYKNAVLWEWTRQRLSKKLLILPDIPTDEQVNAIAQKYGIKDLDYNRKLIQIYLADLKHCKRCVAKKECGTKCYLNHYRKQIKVEEGKIVFEKVVCKGV